ncbi:MAG: hypothetical protein ACTHL3_00315 [Candidatus Nitrosocosmicus sp.]
MLVVFPFCINPTSFVFGMAFSSANCLAFSSANCLAFSSANCLAFSSAN